jgi:N-acetyl-anhydromuramyl-L-alanine amidase AmpD
MNSRRRCRHSTAGIVAVRAAVGQAAWRARLELQPAPAAVASLIVLHSTEGYEGIKKADGVAAMFAAPILPPEKPRSSHYVIDTTSCIRCVPDLMTAWHCGHTGNAFGIGIELCGRADQTRAEWLDALSLPMLNIAARLIADLCREYQIPPVVVNDSHLRAGKSGITTHSFVSLAWKESSHHDPGPGFPLGAIVMAVRRDLLLLG